jgi:hypothetical protein
MEVVVTVEEAKVAVDTAGAGTGEVGQEEVVKAGEARAAVEPAVAAREGGAAAAEVMAEAAKGAVERGGVKEVVKVGA